ncbi:addiction module protein [Anatilimnocola floriformis]|uniref:addiction module protein n=1 Tax=Anatilimnocola floriformis TaxID=2948575 RepID=UPI0020C342D3|nr:addiction module protein [Anatilimnocola floriformis]
MSPQTEKLLEEVLRLPLEERELFASHLLESLDDEFADEAAWSAEIKRRVDDITAGKTQTTPWSEVRQRMLDYKGE